MSANDDLQTDFINSPSSDMTTDELKSRIYAACRDGDMIRVRTFVETIRSKDKSGDLVNFTTNGATPLIMACRNGHAAVVTFLVNRCHADIEMCGSVTFDSEVVNLFGASTRRLHDDA